MKILEFLSGENLRDNISRISHRFPVGVGVICILTLVFFVLLRGELSTESEGYFLRAAFSLIVTFFFSIGLYLASETTSFLKKIDRNILQFIPVGFGVLFFSTFQSDMNDFDNFIYFVLTLSGMVGFLFFSPFLEKICSKNENQKIYYSYFYNMSVVFLMSFILGGVLFALGSIGITAVFTLFDLRDYMNEKVYGDWAITSLSFITPLFALMKMPKAESFESGDFKENAFFSFLVKYIAIPFIYIYFIILYAYSVKVLMHFQEWPKGEVSWMVIGFSIFGYLIYMFSVHFEEENKFIAFFRKGFPFVVIPQLFMLFYAIYLRIAQYDITINRYFVVIFGIWLGVISVYFAFSKQKQISHIPAILTLFTLIISIGPWGVYSLPESRQLTRLENNLKTAGILTNGVITPLKDYTAINKDLSREIYNGIDYLCEFDNCRSIKNLFGDIYSAFELKHKKDFEEQKVKDMGSMSSIDAKPFERKYYPPSKWEIVSEITSKIKVESYYGGYDETKQETVYFYQDGNILQTPIDINGYIKLYKISQDYIKHRSGEFGYYSNTLTFDLKIGDNTIDTIDIKPAVDGLGEFYKQNKKTTLNDSNGIYELSGKNGKYKIVIESISIKNPLYDGTPTDYNYNNISGYILQK